MYSVAGRRYGHSRVILASVLLLCFGVVACAVAYTALSKKTTPVAARSTQKVPAAKPHAVSASSNMLFFGNVYFSRYINDWSMASPLKFAYPFSRLNEFDRTKYDAWIAGLECPTVAGLQQSSAQEDTTLSFNCNPQYLPEAAKWFTAFTLANNHTDNQGAAGFTETQRHLEENSIQYFGHPDPRELGDICDVITVPATVTLSTGKAKKASLPVALCGYHGFIRKPLPESIAVMQRYSQSMPVIAMPHAGKEYVAAPDALKTELYRSMIDSGADVVIGDHPHWVQTTESYKGHLIVYSMGNFIFDQQLRPEMTRSAGINVLLSVDGVSDTALDKWTALAQTCTTYHDDCLATAERQKLTKLSFTMKFGVVGTDDYDKIVKPASPEVQAGILQRMNWPQTMTQLQSPYSSL